MSYVLADCLTINAIGENIRTSNFALQRCEHYFVYCHCYCFAWFWKVDLNMRSIFKYPAPLESLSSHTNIQSYTLHLLVALKLLVRLENADRIVGVALVDGGYTAELLVIPRVRLPVRFDDFLCKERQKVCLVVLKTFVGLSASDVWRLEGIM